MMGVTPQIMILQNQPRPLMMPLPDLKSISISLRASRKFSMPNTHPTRTNSAMVDNSCGIRRPTQKEGSLLSIQ